MTVPAGRLRRGGVASCVMVVLGACSAAPPTVSARDMHGIFSADARPGRRALMIQFLNDGRFGGDKPELGASSGAIIRTQGYWRIGAFDAVRACTIIETKPRTGEWREGFCATIEGARTALDCRGDGDARTCLMERRPTPPAPPTRQGTL